MPELDEINLTLQERKLLQEIVLTGSWEQAAVNLGMTRRQVRLLFTTSEAFKQAYDEYTQEDAANTQREYHVLASDVAVMLEQAKNAEMSKKIMADCPKCQLRFPVYAKVADWATRIHAGEVLLKMAGFLTNQTHLKVDQTRVNVNISLTAGEVLALQKLKMGLGVPEHMYRRLEDLSKQGGWQLPANTIDGEFHALEAGNAGSPSEQ